MEEERATDSMEPQNSHKQSLFSGLVRHFRRIGKSFEFCLSCRHRNNFEVCDSPSERRVPLWNLSWGMPGLSSLIAGAPHQCLALVQCKRSDMDLVVLKIRL